MTGFSNAEEIAVDQVKAIPFLLEDRIVELGGTYSKADQPWGVSSISISIPRAVYLDASIQVKVVVSGNLLTGQNPASAGPLGEAILKALQK